MPKWIHDRAMSLKKDMEKTYGPEKAEQVAFAVATQQSRRLGKSPKKYGTPEGKAVARAKFDKPKKEYKKMAASPYPIGTYHGGGGDTYDLIQGESGYDVRKRPGGTTDKINPNIQSFLTNPDRIKKLQESTQLARQKLVAAGRDPDGMQRKYWASQQGWQQKQGFDMSAYGQLKIASFADEFAEIIKESKVQAVVVGGRTRRPLMDKVKNFVQSGRKKGFIFLKPEHQATKGPKEVFG